MNEKSETGLSKLKPRLKVGVLVVPREEFTYVGRMDAGIAVSSPARNVLNFLTGDKSCEEISHATGISFSEIASLVIELDRAALLDTQATKITVHTRFHSPNAHRASHAGDDSSDAAFQQLKSRLSPELTSTTWLCNVKDGGVSAMNARRNWQVDIFGDSRIATLLYGIFLSSGITQTRLHLPHENRTIVESDLCGGFLRANDIGLSLRARTDELAKELSLFPINALGVTAPIDSAGSTREIGTQKISIVVGTPPSDHLQGWMSEGVAHLIIDNPDGASLTIGPLVLPGQTPCTRCVSITNEDLNILWRDTAWKKQNSAPSEVPVAVAHHVAGLVGLELLSFLDEGSSEIIGTSTRVNFHAPSSIEKRLYARHPACGCTW